jgi:hypothetical protein
MSARACVWVVVVISLVSKFRHPRRVVALRMAGLLARGSSWLAFPSQVSPVDMNAHSPLTVAGAAVGFGLLIGSARTTFPFDPLLGLAVQN